jgi:hypothetical protein
VRYRVRVDSQADHDRVVASLETRIEALTFTDLDEDGVTALLSGTVVAWAEGNGWKVYRRAPSVVPLPPPYQHRHSYVDVGVARPGGTPIVVEIDRTDRRRTRDKLLAESAAGRLAIWIRWGSRAPDPAPEPIHLISCAVTSAPGRRYSREADHVRPAPVHSDLRVADMRAEELFPADDITP